MSSPLLAARNLHVSFEQAGGRVHALSGVDLELRVAETLAIVGESGSGKSTLALALMGVHPPAAGRVEFEGSDVWTDASSGLRTLRRTIQMILQDPYASLDPRWQIGDIIAEPLRAQGVRSRVDLHRRIARLLDQVGLPGDVAHEMPGRLSGGQRQRVAIARALAIEPAIIIADEPVSALDVSIQAQIVNLLIELKRKTGVGLVIISHDLALVRHLADRIVVMYLGRIVEEGPATEVIAAPRHPYTVALVSAVPEIDLDRRRSRIVLGGEPPSPLAPPAGCTFHPRCPLAQDRCRHHPPLLTAAAHGGRAACWVANEVSMRAVSERVAADDGA